MVPEFVNTWGQGWVLTTASSLLCVLGCSVIYYDDLYYLLFPKFITSRYGFHIKENYTFLNGSLAFSSGCLLFTSLYRLLPASMKYLHDAVKNDDNVDHGAAPYSEKWLNFDLMASFIGGILVCLSFNYILHLATSESVVHCNHGDDGSHHSKDAAAKDSVHSTSSSSDDESHSHTHTGAHAHAHTHAHTHSGAHSHDHSHTDPEPAEASESTPLMPTIVKKKSLLHYIIPVKEDAIGECKGYSSAELCLYRTNSHNNTHPLHFCEIPELTLHPDLEAAVDDSAAAAASGISESGAEAPSSRHSVHHHDTNEDHTSHQDHHHHVNSPFSRLLLIGVQTILAITLHKFPEGFITYITSETNPELGVSIFISLLFHNFTEGFSMCLPLYYSFASGASKKYAKFKALAISATLGGLAQPFGALIGYFFLKLNHAGKAIDGDHEDFDVHKLNFIFGITMAVTSGFLTVIGFSMYGSAVSFGGSSNFVLLWCVAGMIVIGVSNILSS